ncbi:tetratricopeptide repeat protein [Emcibacter sp.]|uniref:tetratricopeptide repeat protein n=1 Tax=Emcibacter sp. TaxID=1979954 RepID=UPI003A92C520
MTVLSHLCVMAVMAFVVFWQQQLFAQERLQVRNGDHLTFSRIVFDWTEPVDYTAAIVDNRLRITFGRTAEPDFGLLPLEPVRFLQNPSYSIENGRLVVTMELRETGRLEHFVTENKVVVDLIEMANEDASTAATGVKPVTPPKADKAESNVVAAAATTKVHTEQIQETAVAGKTGLALRVSGSKDLPILTFPWDKDVKAAVFIRHNILWVAFEGKAEIDQSALAGWIGKNSTINGFRKIPHDKATIFIYEMAPGYFAKATKDGHAWSVALRSNYSVAMLPIDIGQQRGSGKGENFFFSYEGVGSLITVKDPVIGDRIFMAPAQESSQGVIKRREYPEFRVLETAQGIAVELYSDRLEVVRYRNGVGISSDDGLSMSRSRLSSKFVMEKDETKKSEQTAEDVRLIDLRRWREGPDRNSEFDANRRELLYSLSQTTDDERNQARWDLARFYLGNGFAADAYGILELMREQEPELLESPEYRAVLGVTNILLRRYDEAVRLLTHKGLMTELDAYLWRSVANGALGNDERVLQDYKKGSDILSLHEPRDRARFLLSAIRAAYRKGDLEFMSDQMKILRKYPLSAEQLTEVDYWQAKLTELSGSREKAEGEYDRVIKAGVRKTSAWASLALVNSELESGKIAPAEAIDRLEKLRFSWRGDDFELELLSRLGELYVQQSDYRTGLETLRQAATYFRDSKKTRELTKTMSSIYRGLFLEGGADRLAPIKAVALYNDYRELTPLGPDGDLMTRRLADRLVSVDLLDKAAEILDHQIKHRLKGIAQADVASRLAMIYILDSRSDEALKILRFTRQAQTPDDIERRRRMIEARALIELGSYEEAEVLLSDYNGEEIEQLRSDIYWKSENWSRVISHSNKLLGNRWQSDQPLTSDERLTVLRLAVALSLAEENNGLGTVRERYMDHMQNGKYADAFEVITAQQQRSGDDVRRLTQSIASVDRLETFMDAYRNEFASNTDQVSRTN